tara:strand:- start:387 stop:926 length:540 start_codon:yes stop_codon:yes gene_type:complete
MASFYWHFYFTRQSIFSFVSFMVGFSEAKGEPSSRFQYAFLLMNFLYDCLDILEYEGGINLTETTKRNSRWPDGPYTETVLPEWIDGNGHMRFSYHGLAFDQPAVAYLSNIGISDNYRSEIRCGVFWGDLQIRYLRELVAGDILSFRYQIINYDKKEYICGRRYCIMRMDLLWPKTKCW